MINETYYYYLKMRYEAKLKFSFLKVSYGFTQICYKTIIVFEDGNLNAKSKLVDRNVR